MLADEHRDPRIGRDLPRHSRRPAVLQRLNQRILGGLAVLVLDTLRATPFNDPGHAVRITKAAARSQTPPPMSFRATFPCCPIRRGGYLPSSAASSSMRR